MHKPVSLFTLVAVVIVACWWWLGSGVPMPPSPLDPGEKLYCVSYAPFRGTQTPLDLTTRIDARQIEQDLAQLAKITDCVRIYAVDAGPRPDPGNRAAARPEGAARALGFELSGPHAIPDHHRHRDRQPISRHRARGDRRQRSAAARRGFGCDLARIHREREGQGESAGHLCRRLGVLDPQSRACERGRFRHRAYPAVLGGRSDRGGEGRGSCRVDPQARRRKFFRQGDHDRRIRLAERRPHARERAAVAGRSGARDRRRSRARQGRRIPRQPHRGVRPAVEALPRRHGRRALGLVRRRVAAAEIRLGRAGVEPSELAPAGDRRRGAGGRGVCRGDDGSAANT